MSVKACRDRRERELRGALRATRQENETLRRSLEVARTEALGLRLQRDAAIRCAAVPYRREA